MRCAHNRMFYCFRADVRTGRSFYGFAGENIASRAVRMLCESFCSGAINSIPSPGS